MDKPTFQSAPVHKAIEQSHLYTRLYLHLTPLGSNCNQSGIVDPKLHNSFGSTVVNDWPLYDRLGLDAKLVAHAQGLHIQAGMKTQSWYNSFCILFVDQSFAHGYKGSSLQVMGPVVEQGEWAIVGGTGKFHVARGVVYKKSQQQKEDGNIVELDVRAIFYALRPWTLGCT